MLGNDIVDYTVDEKKYLNQRFIDRILTSKEQHYLMKSKQKNAYLWTMWAAKEAAYKAIQKEHEDIVFSPILFNIIDDDLGRLAFHDYKTPIHAILYFKNEKTLISFHWPAVQVVHCMARYQCEKRMYDKPILMIRQIAGKSDYLVQSRKVRVLAQKILKDCGISANIERPEIIVKSRSKPGPPRLFSKNNVLLNHQISLSHDKKWIAACFMKAMS